MPTPPHGPSPFGLDRYEDRGPIGQGAMGEVRRVLDRLLGVEVAMKTLATHLAADERARARFLAEATITAGLHHPGIVAVHDRGEHPDGRLWYTMTEVRGRTLSDLLSEAWQHGRPEPEAERVLLDVVRQACEALAHAHQQGLVHRDLKPDNLMVGAFGEVRVMDWGLARRLDRPEPPGRGPAVHDAGTWSDGSGGTQHGEVVGTPAYMAPEQARGEVGGVGPSTDVYALGAVLYQVLCGHPPLTGTPLQIWRRLLRGPPRLFDEPGLPPVDPALQLLCLDAMEWEPADRPADAGQLADRLGAWLDQAARRVEAEALLDAAAELAPRIARLRAMARQRRAAARGVLEPLPPHAASADKEPGWALEDEAAELECEAAVAEVAWRQQVGAALQRVPDHAAAHRALADHHADRLRAAEAAGDAKGEATELALLAEHDRGWYADLLEGTGAVSLVTEPPGAEVELYRVVERGRRRVLQAAGDLGRTPLDRVRLAAGSWVLRLHLAGHAVVTCPVRIGRGEHQAGVRPGESTPHPIRLPRDEELAADDCYVPAGWFGSGGDPEAGEALPGRQVWVDGFVIKRDPVTVAQYLAFVQAVAEEQGRDAAMARVPRRHVGSDGGAVAEPLWRAHGAGEWALGSGPEAGLDLPVTLVSWRDAVAFAAWWGRVDGPAWRLPGGQEWEKAARGVDGRVVAWGDHLEPTWANVLGCRAGAPVPTPVGAFPTDRSVYGVRGTVGNVRDLCGDAWSLGGPELGAGWYRFEPAPDGDPGYREVRGGSFHATPAGARAAGRFAAPPDQVWTSVGFRLARPL